MTDILDPPTRGDDTSLVSDAGTELVDPRSEFRPAGLDDGYSVIHVSDQASAEWDEVERFVYNQFRSVGFCQDSPRQWVEETSPYRPMSDFIAITFEERIVGAIRTIQAPYDKLPIGQFGRRITVPSGELIEFGSLAVEPGHRGLGIVNELHRKAVQSTVIRGLPAFCMLVEPWSIDFYRETYGLPLVQSSPAKEYMGSLTIPAVCRIDEMFENLIRHWPQLFDWTVEDLPASAWSRGDIPIRLS